MRKILEMLSVFIVIVCAANLQFCIASIGNSSINQNYTTRTVPPTNHRRIIVVGWIHKPPYLYAVPNTTQPSGMGEEMVLRFLHSCGATFVDSHQASSEFEMINLLRKKRSTLLLQYSNPRAIDTIASFILSKQVIIRAQYIFQSKTEMLCLMLFWTPGLWLPSILFSQQLLAFLFGHW